MDSPVPLAWQSFRLLPRLIACITAAVCLWSIGASNATAADPPRQPTPRLGINLAGPADWNTELPFSDVFHLSREWISQREGEAWGKGPQLELDEHGWIKQLQPQCFAETPLCTIEDGHYPSGDWTVIWDGQGKIELSKGQVIARGEQRLTVRMDARGGGFFLRVRETNPRDPVRHIRVLMPGVSPEDEAKIPWQPSFLQRWNGVACLRYMDLQETNNSRQKHWSDRPRPEDATYTRAGVPVELLCDLANRLNADPWFCLPHEADDDYVREFARLVKRRLAPERKVFLEYSNEVWNGQFAQHRYAAQRGQELGFAEKKPWEAAWRYTAHRSIQIFEIWQQEWGGRERLVRVLPAQAANAFVASQVAGWKEAGRQADALAIAPYISMNIPVDGNKLRADAVEKWSVTEFLDYVDREALPESIRWIEANKKVADQYGLRLLAYEAGQHFVGIQGAESRESLTKLLHAANAHPRMHDVYAKYYAAWDQQGGDLLCHFSSVSKWSKWGSWGLLQHADDDPRSHPKFMATIEWARSKGQRMNLPAPSSPE
jgi:hypothetical protein